MANTYAPRHNQAAQRKAKIKARRKSKKKMQRLSPALGTLATVTLMTLSLTHSGAAFLLISVIALFFGLGIVAEGRTRPIKGRHHRMPIDPEAEAGEIVEAAEQILIEEAHNTPIEGVPVVQEASETPDRRRHRFLLFGTVFYLVLTAASQGSSRRLTQAQAMQDEIDYQLWEGWKRPPYGSE